MTDDNSLTRREREIMDLVFELGEVSIRDLIARLEDAPTDSAVRTMVARLEKKEQLLRRQEGPRNLYRAATPRGRARRSAVSKLLRTFFDGSVEEAVSALLANPRSLDTETLDRLVELIESKRRESGR